MGIRDLNKVLKKYTPGALQVVALESLAGTSFAIDISGMVYAAVSIRNSKAYPRYYYLQLIFQRLTRFMGYGINVVVIFDGPPPPLKQHILAERAAKNAAGKGVMLDEDTFDLVYEMIDLLGLPIIRSNGEAEAHAAMLAKRHIVDYVVTQDLDALAFGAPYVIRDVDLTEGTATLITLADVLAELQIDMARFIEFCILLGGDYTEKKIHGVGMVAAMKLLIHSDASIWDGLTSHRYTIPPEFTYGPAMLEYIAPWVFNNTISTDLPPARPVNLYLREWFTNYELTSKAMENILIALKI